MPGGTLVVVLPGCRPLCRPGRAFLRRSRARPVHVIVFDDFAADPAAAYRSTLAFLDLEVDEDHLPDFTVRNAHKSPRSQLTVRLLRNPPPLLRTVTRVWYGIRRPGALRIPRDGAERYKRPRSPLPPELRRTLQAEVVEDVKRLEKLLGRDLSSWLEPASDGQQADTMGPPGQI